MRVIAFLLCVAGLLAMAVLKGSAVETTGGPQTNADRPWLPCPYPASQTIAGIEFDLTTRQTHAMGSDIWPITWADDDHQYTAFGDGAGFGVTDAKEQNGPARVSMGVSRVEGDWRDYRGVNVWGGKNAENPAQFQGKGTGILSIDGTLYMMVAYQGSLVAGGTRPAVSRDHSRTWQPAPWQWTAQDCLSAGTLLNFGKDYQGARDGYVYAYFTRINTPPEKPRNWIHEVPGRVDLARVPKGQILSKEAYEWYAGPDGQGGAKWTRDLAKRAHVFEDPNGIKVVSVCHNAGLKRYLMLYNPKDNRGNLGLFEAPEPWGPWRSVAYMKGYTPFMPPAPNTRVSIFHFAPKWWSADGREFTLIFNTGDDAWNTVRGRLTTGSGRAGEP